MLDIDLKPDDYSFRDPRTGRIVKRISKRLARNYSMFCFAVVAFVGYNWTAFPAWELAALVGVFAFGAGVMMANWLFDFY